MLFKVCTKEEATSLASRFPKPVADEVLRSAAALDREYGEARDGSEIGGYILIVENSEDIPKLKVLFDFERCTCEWVAEIGSSPPFLSALYLLNNDFSVQLLLPETIAPQAILKELEDKR